MISLLKGTLVQIDELKHRVVLDVGGVGYGLQVHTRDLAQLTQHRDQRRDQTVMLHTYLHVREDSLELFGFLSEVEKQCFGDLISVNGIGPRLGMVILGTSTLPELLQAVRTENAAFFKSMPGVGPKTAQRIILELQTKVKKWAMDGAVGGSMAVPHTQEAEDLRSTFANLGYSSLSIERALMSCQREAGFIKLSLEEKIREMLKKLSKGPEKVDTL